MKKLAIFVTILTLVFALPAFAAETTMADITAKWAKGQHFSTEATLPEETLCRLLVTYYLDKYPDLPLAQLMEFEVRCNLIDLEGTQVYLCQSMTHEGNIAFTVNAITGALLNTATESGGNG